VEIDGPIQVPDDTPVIVTFLTSEEADLLDEQREAEMLAQSPAFRRLIDRTLAEIEAGETITFEALLDALGPKTRFLQVTLPTR